MGIDNVAARLQWDCEYTTRLWQPCERIDSVAARLQRIVNILQACKDSTTLSPPCHFCMGCTTDMKVLEFWYYYCSTFYHI